MKSTVFGVLLSLWVVGAHAQAPGLSINGTIETIGPATLTLRGESGVVETFGLAPSLVVLRNHATTLADIKPNDFVASAAVRGPDGKLHSTEFRIFPEALRGLGEGQRPMNDARSQTMTNATVTGTVIVDGSNTIKVTFPGGESEMILDSGVPVTRIESVYRSALAAGLSVRVQGARTADGVVATRIILLQ